ncbi:MAG: hypothetical protein V1855_03740, partial [bacterium]
MKIPENYVKIMSIFLWVLFCSTMLLSDNRVVLHLRQAPEQVLTSVQAEIYKEKGINKINGLSKKTPAQVSKKIIK